MCITMYAGTSLKMWLKNLNQVVLTGGLHAVENSGGFYWDVHLF